MAVRFILGRSGTGKTSYCVKAIVDALVEGAGEQSLILLVPEQATYQAERAILSDKRVGGYSRLHVLSFDRLRFLVSGKNTARPAVSQLGQQMIIQRILRDNGDRLKVFGSPAAPPLIRGAGLGRQMAETIAELSRYAKTPEDVEQLVGELQKDERNNLAALKFADIGVVFKEYLRFIEGKFVDPDVQLSKSRVAISEAEFIKGASVWVDGFAGFTTAELEMLAELLKAAADVQIAMCLDASKIDLKRPSVESIDPAGLFNPTERTYYQLVEMIRRCKLQLAEPVILKEAVRFAGCPQLAHIEGNVFGPKPSKIAAADNVRIISAPNGRSEVRFVAREILRLVKEADCRYRDIAVIASDIDSYEHYIRAYFDDYGIPFFIDKRKSASQHPVVGFICSALQAAAGGFSSSDVFAYLKSDLVPIERYGVDLLENYCVAFGVTGGDWLSDRDWDFAGKNDGGFDERRINDVRRDVSGPLLELRDKLGLGEGSAKTVGAGEFTRAIFDFLDGLGVREKIEEWIEQCLERGDYASVNEHRQFYERLIDVFDELVEVFGEQRMASKDLIAIVGSAFSQLALAFIPPTLDEVLVGSIERSRHPDLKAVFLIGATQSRFPVPVGFGGILTDEDRTAAGSADFALAATAAERLTERQYLAYIAFTRPSRFLCVTYPLADDSGSAVARSEFITAVESLFEGLGEESIAGGQVEIEKVNSEYELAEVLCSRLGKDVSREAYLVKRISNGVSDEPRPSQEGLDERLGRLLEDICADEQLAGLGAAVLSAIDYDNSAQLDEEMVGRFFGGQIKSSATRLGSFAACPYRYFARYVLELKERKEFKLRPLDVGAFYHCVLDALLKRVNAEGRDFATIESGELLGFLREEVSKFVQTDAFISKFVGHSAHNKFIIYCAIEELEDCVLAVAEMVRAGGFRPALSEVSFGDVKNSIDNIGEYKIELSNGRVLSINGKIDRLDVADDGKTAIIFDYKRRGASFSWSRFYYGLDMQLPIYMLAVRNAGGSKVENVVGAFYMPVEAKVEGAVLDEIPGKIEKFRHKANGLFNGDFFQQLDKSNSNKFYNFFVTKKGDQYGYGNISGALRPGDFEKVLKFTENRIVELAEEIASGRIDVGPYRLSGQTACSYCEYKSLCRFDWQINDYRPLVSVNKVEVLEQI